MVDTKTRKTFEGSMENLIKGNMKLPGVLRQSFENGLEYYTDLVKELERDCIFPQKCFGKKTWEETIELYKMAVSAMKGHRDGILIDDEHAIPYMIRYITDIGTDGVVVITEDRDA
jgi:hypothetical protein